MSRGRGCLPDTIVGSGHPISTILGVGMELPDAVDLRQYAEPIGDQGDTNSCVGWARAAGLYIRGRITGETVPRLSAHGIYTFARMVDRLMAGQGIDGNPPPLQDGGCTPAAALAGMQRWGIPTAEEWPFNPGEINRELTVDQHQAASDFIVSGYYRILSVGDQRVVDLMRALAHGFPVEFAVDIDESIDHYGGGTLRASSGPGRGGHMLLLVGYRRAPEGVRFIIRNSWGTSWGIGGYGEGDESFVCDSDVRSMTALTLRAA